MSSRVSRCSFHFLSIKLSTSRLMLDKAVLGGVKLKLRSRHSDFPATRNII